MNWSADVVVLVPLEVVTVTSTVPADSAGDVAVIDVEEVTLNEVAATLPKDTFVVPDRLSPVTVTIVPPAVEPVAGDTELTDGGEAGGGGGGGGGGVEDV